MKRKKQTKVKALLELMDSKEGREMMKHTDDLGGHLISGNKRCNIQKVINITRNTSKKDRKNNRDINRDFNREKKRQIYVEEKDYVPYISTNRV